MVNDKAVSPVIGVILMVAITVILAAVISAFIFGMSGNVSKEEGTKSITVIDKRIDWNNQGAPFQVLDQSANIHYANDYLDYQNFEIGKTYYCIEEKTGSYSWRWKCQPIEGAK